MVAQGVGRDSAGTAATPTGGHAVVLPFAGAVDLGYSAALLRPCGRWVRPPPRALPPEGPVRAARLHATGTVAWPKGGIATLRVRRSTHAHAVPDPMPIATAFERVRAEVESVPDDAVAAIHVDILHAEHKRSDKPVARLPEMHEEAVAFRESVIAVGRSVVLFQRIETTACEQTGRLTGYSNVAHELMGLRRTTPWKLTQLGARGLLTAEPAGSAVPTLDESRRIVRRLASAGLVYEASCQVDRVLRDAATVHAASTPRRAARVTLRLNGAAVTWLHGAARRCERGAGVGVPESRSGLLSVVGVRRVGSGPGVPHRRW